MSSIAPLAGAHQLHALGATPAAPSPEKLHSVAQQFEALLIGEMLKTAREASKDSSGDDDSDSAGESAMDMAQSQFAQSIAMSGGLGLSHLIESGLAKDSANQKVKTSEPVPTDARS